MVSLQDTMNNISHREKIEEIQKKYSLNHKEARIYLSSMIFTINDEEDCNIKKKARELQEEFSRERLEKYKIELNKWKSKEVIANTEELDHTLQDLNKVQSPSEDWNSLFDGQRRLVEIAHNYFNSLKQRIENVLKEDREIAET